jgi:hypothetical protein
VAGIRQATVADLAFMQIWMNGSTTGFDMFIEDVWVMNGAGGAVVGGFQDAVGGGFIDTTGEIQSRDTRVPGPATLTSPIIEAASHPAAIIVNQSVALLSNNRIGKISLNAMIDGKTSDAFVMEATAATTTTWLWTVTGKLIPQIES